MTGESGHRRTVQTSFGSAGPPRDTPRAEGYTQERGELGTTHHSRGHGLRSLAIAALTLSACGSDESTTVESTTPVAATETATETANETEPITLAETADIVDTIAGTFDTAEFGPIEESLGENGTWVASGGAVYDRESIAALLREFENIAQIVRDDVSAEGLGGYGFRLTETFDSGDSVTFWIFVSRDSTGTLTITEQPSPPT